MSLSSLNPKNSNYDAAKLFVEAEENLMNVIDIAQKAAEKEAIENPNAEAAPASTQPVNFGPTSKQGW